MTDEPQSKALDYTIDLCEEITGEKLTIGALPPDGGISCEISAGYQTAVYLDKTHRQRTIPLLFLCKDKNQKIALNTLFRLGNCLDRLVNFKHSTDFQICGFELKTEAGLVGKEGDFWIYSMIVDMKLFY